MSFLRRMFFVFLLLMLVGALGAVDTSSVMSAQSDQRTGLAVISGKVKDVKGAGVKGAVVTVEGQKAKATTAANGSFKLTGVAPGSAYLYVKTPSAAYLDGETLKAIPVKSGAQSYRRGDNPLGPSECGRHLCRREELRRVPR